MSNLIKNITEFALYLVQGYVSEGDVVVDATCGNGYDTLRLAQLSPAKLYAFDIQQEAVDATRKRLREAGFAEKLKDGAIEVICDSHEHLTDHVKTFIQAAVFNLGYLPGADKGCTTSASSTMRAVRSCLSRLEPDGLVCITMYSGHPAGRQEKEHLLAFAENLDKRQWHCAYINLINQPAAPPEILLITRKKRPEKYPVSFFNSIISPVSHALETSLFSLLLHPRQYWIHSCRIRS